MVEYDKIIFRSLKKQRQSWEYHEDFTSGPAEECVVAWYQYVKHQHLAVWRNLPDGVPLDKWIVSRRPYMVDSRRPFDRPVLMTWYEWKRLRSALEKLIRDDVRSGDFRNWS